MPNVQCKTPDDEQRNCPKHVEILDENKFGELMRLLVLIKRDFFLLLRLRISGAVPLFAMCVFVAWAGTTLPFQVSKYVNYVLL